MDWIPSATTEATLIIIVVDKAEGVVGMSVEGEREGVAGVVLVVVMLV